MLKEQRMPRHNNFTINIGLALCSIVLALLLMEGGVRLLDLPPKPLAPLPIPSYRLADDPAIIYEYRPNYTPADEPFDRLHAGYAINRQGFRDYDYKETKPPGTYRIIMLGDSTTAGNGVAKLEDIYPKQLERLLNAAAAPNTRYEVLNMAVGGYQTMQEVATLRAKGLKYGPDMVCILMCLNDFDLHADGGVYAQLVNANASGIRSATHAFSRWVLRSSRLAFILYYRLLGANLDSDEWYVTHILHGKTTVRAGFELFAELQQQHGFTAYVLILPDFRFPFDAYQSEPIHQAIAQSMAGLRNLTLLDLRVGFAAVDADARKFSYDGAHLNEYGHAVLANMLVPLVPLD
jgi:lysophospholipase L1-like esterase